MHIEQVNCTSELANANVTVVHEYFHNINNCLFRCEAQIRIELVNSYFWYTTNCPPQIGASWSPCMQGQPCSQARKGIKLETLLGLGISLIPRPQPSFPSLLVQKSTFPYCK